MGIEVKNIKMERSIKNLTYFGLTFIQLRMNKYKKSIYHNVDEEDNKIND